MPSLPTALVQVLVGEEDGSSEGRNEGCDENEGDPVGKDVLGVMLGCSDLKEGLVEG